MTAVDGIICMPDLLRGTRNFPEAFFDLVREPIQQGAGIAIGYPPGGKKPHGLKPGFDLAEFRARAGMPPSIFADDPARQTHWTANYHCVTDSAIDYLFQYMPARHLLLAFEIPPWLERACIARDVEFLNLAVSPLRFGRDLYVALRCSSEILRQRIAPLCVPCEELRLEAALLGANVRMHRLRMEIERNYHFESLDDALVFVGQAPYDASLLAPNGSSLRCTDYADTLRTLSQGKILRYKPHPFAPDFSRQECIALQRITGQTPSICNQSAYQILSSEDDVELVGISSGLLQEAAWFGKKSHTLFQPFVPLAKEGELSDSAYLQMHFKTLLSPDFWHRVLAPQRPAPRLAALPDVAHSHARALLDHWWDYSKVLTWERALPHESFMRGGGAAMRQRIETLEQMGRTWLNEDEAPLLCADVENLLKDRGVVERKIGGVSLTLHLEHPHERRYAACLKAPLRYPQYDIDKMFIQRFIQTGDIVLDGGANIGLTALHFLEQGAARVVAVEPLPELASRIQDLHEPRIICVEAALSESTGYADLHVSQEHNQGSTCDQSMLDIFPAIFGKERKTIRIPTITIDSLIEDCDVWKLDLEGAELSAIRGAQEKLDTAPPRLVYVELFDQKYHAFRDFIENWFSFVYRVGIRKSDYSLALLAPEDFSEKLDDFYPTSPTYIFSLKSLVP